MDASQSGTEGEISARPNGQLSQKVADQLKEQLRLDSIRYGADCNKGQDTREAFETAYRALMDILGKI